MADGRHRPTRQRRAGASEQLRLSGGDGLHAICASTASTTVEVLEIT